MKPILNSLTDSAPLVAFGAHPDDIEFGCGGIIAREASEGRPIHFVVCSRGESGTHGTPTQRTAEAKRAAKLLGATLEFVRLDGDAHLEIRAAHALKLAAILRRVRPSVVLAPSTETNQHPDHWRLGQLVRDAARLARFGGVKELKRLTPHTLGQLYFYAVSVEAEPAGTTPVLFDLSADGIVETWSAAMSAHATQLRTRNYVELQLARAQVQGLRAGLKYAQALYPDSPLVFHSLAQAAKAARRF